VQARQLAGTQATLTPSFAGGAPSASSPDLSAAVAASPLAPAEARAQVSGTVSLDPSLLSRASPEDTVFIYARSSGGPRMPLAVLKKQVKDLPLRFTLDDSLAMSPNSKLSSATKVVVGARIAKGGNAVAREGDLQGQIAAVPLGTGDLNIQINEVIGVR
jgi:cytochrome c-type biogenesis protein CcmH